MSTEQPDTRPATGAEAGGFRLDLSTVDGIDDYAAAVHACASIADLDADQDVVAAARRWLNRLRGGGPTTFFAASDDDRRELLGVVEEQADYEALCGDTAMQAALDACRYVLDPAFVVDV